jgi:hypothetical protein
MTLEELIGRASGFNQWTHADKLRLFAWYLQTHKGLVRFRTADLTACFDEVHIHRPSNPSQFVRQLCEQKQFISDREGFRLERALRSELDIKWGQRDETIVVDRLLSDLPSQLSVQAEKEYLEEALICFRNQAFRAAILMTWNVVYDHLVARIIEQHVGQFNAQMSTMFGGKKKPVSLREDFQRLQESEVIEVCSAAGIVSREVGKVLREKLDKRNSAAHPSGARFDKLQAEAFISDLIKNALQKVN